MKTQKPEPFKYYVPENDRVKVYDEKGDVLGFLKYAKLGRQGIVGLICHYISQGHSLSEVASGKGWRPTERIFLIWVNHSKTFKRMYARARKMREEMLLEELIKAQRKNDKEKVTVLSLTLKAFDKKIVRKILPPPIVVERSDWRHSYKKQWKLNLPQKGDLNKGIDILQKQVEGKYGNKKKPVTFEDLKTDLMEE